MTVYGPYVGMDSGRKIVIVNGVTISYARYLWEQKFGPIEEGYEVDHINDDCTDDRIENYQLLTKLDNLRKSRQGLVIKHPTRTEEQKEKYRGSNNDMFKLTSEQIKELRFVRPKGTVMLDIYVAKFGVTRRTLENILRHKSYK